MDLSNLPPDTCPLCGQAALNRTGRAWSCGACGCRLAFDPQTRRAQIVHFPEAFADLEGPLGGRWLTRREMFMQVAEAQQRALTPPNPQFTLLAATTLTILTAFSMLATVAVAFVLSPSLARTRQTIAAAYQPTPSPALAAVSLPTQALTPTPTTDALAASPEPTIANGSADEVPTPAGDDEERIATPETPATEPPPAAPPPPPLPDNALPVPPNPGEAVGLPPTFTPAPAAMLPTIANPLVSPLLPTATPEATATPPPSPTAIAPTPTSAATPLPPGSMVFRGSLRIRNIRAVGSEPNQGDEYVELQNEGTEQVNLAGWTLRAIRSVDGAILSIFVFPGNAVIAAGQTCRIYTNLLFAAANCGFSGGFLSPIPIWPDGGGAHASLFNPEGIEYTRFAY